MTDSERSTPAPDPDPSDSTEPLAATPPRPAQDDTAQLASHPEAPDAAYPGLAPSQPAGPAPAPRRSRSRLTSRTGLLVAALALVAACVVGAGGVAVGFTLAHVGHSQSVGERAGGRHGSGPGRAGRDEPNGGGRHDGNRRAPVPSPTASNAPSASSPAPSATN